MNVSSGKIIVLKVASVFGGEAKRNRIQRDLPVLFRAIFATNPDVVALLFQIQNRLLFVRIVDALCDRVFGCMRVCLVD